KKNTSHPCKPLNKTAEEIQFSGSLWTVLKSGALISGSNCEERKRDACGKETRRSNPVALNQISS
ncbi:MAG: hypothetical protein FWE69_06035, partial [Clostridiales bacterium]|nr:hypothetical protein [Clostridiales bacterium]